MIARSHTRAGEPVHIGNDPSRMPGPENTYQSYGTAWANLSNAPFRFYKHWIHEGGISTPLIVHWPKGIADKGAIRHAPGYLPDIMATILDLTGTPYPDRFEGHDIAPLEGVSLAPAFARDGFDHPPMFWEHEGHAAVRIGKWKLVRAHPGPWELYDMEADRTELHDVAAQHPGKVAAMAKQYEDWAARCGVIPRDKIVALMKSQGVTRAFWEKDWKGSIMLPPGTRMLLQFSNIGTGGIRMDTEIKKWGNSAWCGFRRPCWRRSRCCFSSEPRPARPSRRRTAARTTPRCAERGRPSPTGAGPPARCE
jgi:arylsulfatase